MTGKGRRWIGVLAMLGLATAIASGGVSTALFRVDANSSLGAGFVEINSSNLVPAPVGQTWTLAGAMEIGPNPGTVIAVLESATVSIVDDGANYPRITMNYTIRAGHDAAAAVVVTGPRVNFGSLPVATSAVRATAGFTLTDVVNGNGNAAIAGPGGGMGMAQFRYNGAAPGAGTMFTSLISGLSTNGGGTASLSGQFPNAGFFPIGASLSSITIQHQFSLTSGDLMSGQSLFVGTPEPASLALVALGLFLVRRR